MCLEAPERRRGRRVDAVEVGAKVHPERSWFDVPSGKIRG